MSGKPPETLRVALISDFNVGNLRAALESEAGEPAVTTAASDFGAVFPTLLDPKSPLWSDRPDLTVVWTLPESVLGTVSRALAGEVVDPESIADEVEEFVRALSKGATHTRWMVVPTWLPPFGTRGTGVTDLHEPTGLAALLADANRELIRGLRQLDNVWVLDASPWAAEAGPARTNRRYWYAARIPFPPTVFRAAARDLKAFLRAATGRARKVVFLDLDNTLWGGVVGETGWEGITLGGHDPIGEAFVDFQRALKALTRRGVVLAIVSKNEEAVAMEAIRRHPEMVLREDDFAGWRINWEDKAANVLDLLHELRLGKAAAVFIDDQPAERARVNEAIPEILVPEWPVDPLGSVEALERLACFDLLRVSSEDSLRARSYVAERERLALRDQISGPDEWIERLSVKVQVEELGPESLARAAQLLNKTNQMNLATRRLSEAELRDWTEKPENRCFTFRVSDRFGEFGLTGLLSLEQVGSDMEIVDFLLSCRVMSRRVEETMVHVAVEHARSLSLGELRARFSPTERNAPMLAFWKDASGFEDRGEGLFGWDLANAYPMPRGVEAAVASGSQTSAVADTTRSSAP